MLTSLGPHVTLMLTSLGPYVAIAWQARSAALRAFHRFRERFQPRDIFFRAGLYDIKPEVEWRATAATARLRGKLRKLRAPSRGEAALRLDLASA